VHNVNAAKPPGRNVPSLRLSVTEVTCTAATVAGGKYNGGIVFEQPRELISKVDLESLLQAAH
jgi:hypothetical protein